MDTQERVAVQIEDGVAEVRLNRPEKMNALDPAMFQALVETSDRLRDEPGVRAVVLSGEGRAFCAGLDFGSFQAMGDRDERREPADSAANPRRANATPALENRITHLGQQAAYGWMELDVPVIAAITGVALGGGAQVALGADLRIMAPDAKISVLEIRWGLTPDMTGTVTLSRLVGADVAKELTWTGRMVTGTEAVEIGLATKVSETPLDDALALAKDIASKNPAAIQGAKRLLDQVDQRSVAEQFEAERVAIAELIGSPNQREAVKAFFEKRPPVFSD